MTFETVFPYDIFELIINEVSKLEGAKSILQACSLVCTSFVGMCQRHIFNTIKIGVHHNTSITMTRLVDLLKRKPVIASYVKNVKLTLNSGDELMRIRYSGKAENCRSIYDDEEAGSLHLSSYLPNVQDLTIDHMASLASENHVYPCDDDSCRNLVMEVTRDLSENCPSLTSVSINHLYIPLGYVLKIPNLRILRLEACSWERHIEQLDRIPLERLHLKKIMADFPLRVLDHCDKLSSVEAPDFAHFTSIGRQLNKKSLLDEEKMPVSGFNNLHRASVNDILNFSEICAAAESRGDTALPGLHTLEVLFNGSNIEAEGSGLCRMLHHAPNIEELCLRQLTVHPHTGHGRLHVKQFFSRRLRRIRLQYSDGDSLNDIFSISSLCDALDNIKGNTGNQLTLLDFRVLVPRSELDEWMSATLPHWNRLDGILTGNEGSDFPNLAIVSIAANGLQLADIKKMKRIREYLARALPSLCQHIVRQRNSLAALRISIIQRKGGISG